MNKNSKIAKFISGKGFYVALAVCLIGAGAASWIAVDRTLSGLEGDVPDTASNVGFFETSGSADVGKHTSNIQKEPSQNPSHSSSQPSGSASSTDTTVKAEPSQTQQKQYFMLPVSGEIQQEYSNRELVKSVTMGDWRTHNGVDIACYGDAEGEPIIAAASGKVRVSNRYDSYGGGYGYYTTIDHGYDSYGRRIITLYAHCSEVLVYEGQEVEAGEVIGYVGNTGNSYGAHLHFEVLVDFVAVDPTDYLDISDIDILG